ncbi:reverse transcriptase N-terminal domain-containing protein [Pseudomonas gessardii]|nr:reverse transcriptase N-terminal domain-containing protein [Pseudomonas gessardii]
MPLTHWFSGKVLALKRVPANKGKNTPGVDKVTWDTPRAKIGAIASLKR